MSKHFRCTQDGLIEHIVTWVNFFLKFFLTKCLVEIWGINKENDKIKNNFWPSASNHDAE